MPSPSSRIFFTLASLACAPRFFQVPLYLSLLDFSIHFLYNFGNPFPSSFRNLMTSLWSFMYLLCETNVFPLTFAGGVRDVGAVKDVCLHYYAPGDMRSRVSPSTIRYGRSQQTVLTDGVTMPASPVCSLHSQPYPREALYPLAQLCVFLPSQSLQFQLVPTSLPLQTHRQ